MGLDLVELVIAMEDHFGVDIPNADAARLRTPGDIIEYLSPRLLSSLQKAGVDLPHRSTSHPWKREQIEQDVRALVMQQLGLESITDDARFVEDLGAD